jgi:hypothetical protein
MKKTLLLSILVALFSTRAHATLDPNFPYHFNYTVGANLIGNGAWVQAGPNPIVNTPTIVSGNLKICGAINGSGGSVSFGGNGTSARAVLYNTYSSGSLYYSFNLKLTDISAMSGAGVFFVGFNNSSSSSASTPTVVTTRLFAKKSGSGYVLGVGVDGSGTVYDTTVHYVNETLFIVGGYTYGATPTEDYSQLWINPDASYFGAGSAPTTPLTVTLTTGWTGTGSDAPITSLVLFERLTTEPSGIIDEMYVGTEWADVTPTGSPALAITSVTKNDVTGCYGNANGSITVTPTDGFGPGPLQFSKDNGSTWVSGANSYTFSSLAAGSYRIKVKDANGDCATASYSGNPVTISQPAAVAASAGSDKTVCAGGSVGIGGSPTGSGGTGLLSYLWSPATGLDSATAPNPMASPAGTTTYTVTVTDANNCTGSDSVLVTVNSCGGVASVTITNISGTTLAYTGGAGAQFVLLKSPGVTAPLSSWSREHTNNVTPGSFTIPAVGTGGDTVFYSIKSE